MGAPPSTLATLGIKKQGRLRRWLQRLLGALTQQISEATSLFLQRDGGRMKPDMLYRETESSDPRTRYPRAAPQEPNV
jgi:hypothetical protein